MNELIYSFYQYSRDKLPFYLSMAGVTYPDPEYIITKKDFDGLSFEYVIDGQGVLETENGRFELKKNDVYILHRNETYKYWSEPLCPWKKSWAVFGGQFAEAIFEAYIPEGVYVVSGLDISSLLDSLIKTASEENLSYDEISERAAVIITEIAQTIHRFLLRRELSPAEKIEQWINANVDGRILLDDICREINYSKNQAIKLFKKRYGTTPYAYYENKRVENAKKYLSRTNLTIAEIADKMSYSDRSYFFAVFKNATGLYPAEYRKIASAPQQ